MTLDVTAPASLRTEIKVPGKTLLGAGPTNVHPRVLRALAQHQLGHLHTETIQAMDQVKEGLRYTFQTQNDVTLCVSATGHGGMECAISNVVEPGDIVVVGVVGLWGLRACEAIRRNGGRPEIAYANEGEPLLLNAIALAVRKYKPKVVFLVHGDTSTGVLQPLEGVGELCHQHNALLVVDTVATAGGVPLYVDRWGIDVAYSASQKALGAPTGLAPITFSKRAVDVIRSRRKPCTSFFWDVTELGQYWGCFGYEKKVRPYHHTVPVNLVFALREALAMLAEEGLENSWRRHSSAASELVQRVASLGFTPFVPNEANRLPTVTTLRPPASKAAKWATEGSLLVKEIMNKYLIEVAAGLGPTAGKIIRVGLMGQNAQHKSVDTLISALSGALTERSKL